MGTRPRIGSAGVDRAGTAPRVLPRLGVLACSKRGPAFRSGSVELCGPATLARENPTRRVTRGADAALRLYARLQEGI